MPGALLHYGLRISNSKMLCLYVWLQIVISHLAVKETEAERQYFVSVSTNEDASSQTWEQANIHTVLAASDLGDKR